MVVPCSGIGKALGASRARRPMSCATVAAGHHAAVALSKLVLGDEQARERVRSGLTITIDGCKLICAANLVEAQRRNDRT